MARKPRVADPRKRARRHQVLASEGTYGYTVSLVRRAKKAGLWIRWWDQARRGGKGNYVYHLLPHDDVAKGEEQCRLMAAVLLKSRAVRRSKAPAALRGETGPLTLVGLFAAYEAAKINAPTEGGAEKKSAKQAASDRRRMDYWTDFAGLDRDPITIDEDVVADYVAWRRAGASVGDTTLGHEITFLRGVFAWAVNKVIDGKPLMIANPIAGVKRMRSARPNAPIMGNDRFLRIYRWADRVDPQRLLGPMMMLAREHGWRVNAWCRLWASDLTLEPVVVDGVVWPHGQIEKRPENDKRKKHSFSPLSPRSRRAAVRALRRSGATGDAPLFPAPASQGPWQIQHALDLLHRAELAAGHAERVAFIQANAALVSDRVLLRKGRGSYPLADYIERFPAELLNRAWARRTVARINEALGTTWTASIEPVPGFGFHSLRRKWGTDRKGMPLVDVAETGDWNKATLLHYQRADAATKLNVVLVQK